MLFPLTSPSLIVSTNVFNQTKKITGTVLKPPAQDFRGGSFSRFVESLEHKELETNRCNEEIIGELETEDKAVRSTDVQGGVETRQV